MTASDGHRPPGKMYVWIQLAPRQLPLVGGVGEGDRLQAQPAAGPSAASHVSKNVARYSAPTASSISIETIASYVPVMSR